MVSVIAQEAENMSNTADDKDRHEFHIQIDRVHFTVTQREMTGAELRRVPPTPIGLDRDLFEVIPGGPDRKIGDNDIVTIHDGERFFTAPSHINPGKSPDAAERAHVSPTE